MVYRDGEAEDARFWLPFFHLAQDGWIHKTGGSYGSNNGYDNVFYNPNTGEVLIDESKQWGPKLSAANNDTGLPKQMSNLWIEHVISKVAPNNAEFAAKIQYALDNDLLIKTVSSVKKGLPQNGGGSIVTIRVGG